MSNTTQPADPVFDPQLRLAAVRVLLRPLPDPLALDAAAASMGIRMRIEQVAGALSLMTRPEREEARAWLESAELAMDAQLERARGSSRGR